MISGDSIVHSYTPSQLLTLLEKSSYKGFKVNRLLKCMEKNPDSQLGYDPIGNIVTLSSDP